MGHDNVEKIQMKMKMKIRKRIRSTIKSKRRISSTSFGAAGSTMRNSSCESHHGGSAT
jgi:hypothetical protein